MGLLTDEGDESHIAVPGPVLGAKELISECRGCRCLVIEH